MSADVQISESTTPIVDLCTFLSSNPLAQIRSPAGLFAPWTQDSRVKIISLIVRVHTYIHTSIHACMHACMRTYVHTYIHTYKRVYICTYIQTYVQIAIHVCTRLFVYLCEHANVFYRYTYTYICIYAVGAYMHSLCVYLHIYIQASKHINAGTCIHVHVYTQIYIYILFVYEEGPLLLCGLVLGIEGLG